MITYNRICIKDYLIEDKIGQKFTLKRGQEYLTSKDEDGEVVVFSKFWIKVPSILFAGEIKFT